MLTNGPLKIFHLQLGGNVHAAADGAGDGAMISVEAVHAFGSFAAVGRELQMVAHVDATNDHDVIFFLDFARCFGHEPPFSGGYVARLQRATQGARQSTGCRSNDVI